MPKNTTLRILNPLLALLMLSQLLSGLWRPHLSPEAFMWLHTRGGVALLAAVMLHVAANWDWVWATAGGSSRGRAKAKPCPPPRQPSFK